MGKLVLAIIVVACLQAAFVVYVVIDNPADVIAYVPDPDPGYTNFDIASISNPEQFDAPVSPVAETAASRPARRPAATVPLAVHNRRPAFARQDSIAVNRTRTQRHASRVRPAERYALRARSETNFERGFSNTVILYNRDGALTADRIANVPRAKKRSFIAKAMPVLKKPWELIKGIASRLD